MRILRMICLPVFIISALFCLSAPAQNLGKIKVAKVTTAPYDIKPENRQDNTTDFSVQDAEVRIAPQVVDKPRLVPGTCDLSGNVEVEATGGTNAAYSTLKAAFDAINAGTHTGEITIDICADTTETASAVLNASGTGSASYTTIAIAPAGGAARLITGSLSAPLIDLNGADNVTIDGINADGNSLTISNTNSGAASTTSTIRFIGGATSNTITRTSILGSATMALGTNGGNIFFSTDTAGGNGNDDNTISNCNIGPAGTNLPTKLIYGNGSTTTATIRNSGIVISNNNLYDYFSATTSVSGIHILSGNDNWNIANNRIYQTAARTFTGTSLRYAGITINSTTLPGAFTITGNKIGFGAADGTGTTTISGSTNEFRGIDAISVNATTPTSIQGNTVSGINQTTGRNSTGSTSGAFTGILLGSSAGRFDVGTTTGNNVGSLDGSSTIVINGTSTTASTTPAMGIFDFSTSANTISNNNIGSITIQGAGTTLGFRGIYAFTGGTVTETISNNTIANITDTQVGSYGMFGIYVNLPAGVVTGNTVYNINGASNGTNIIVGSGVFVTNTSSTNPSNISQNNVYGLTNNSGTASNSIYAIYCNLPSLAANLVSRNSVRALSVVSTAITSQMVGILPIAGSATYQNNMVSLGSDASGAPITTGYVMYGMFEVAGTNNIYHNSVYLSGTGITAPGSTTFAFVSNITTIPLRNYINNIFYNGRSNAVGGGAAHIALGLSGTTTTNLVSNYNDLYAPGTDGYVGSFNGNAYATLAAFQTATGTDANSFSVDPQFVSATDLHLQATSPMINVGTTTSVTDDFDGQTRDSMPDVGADEVVVLPPGTLQFDMATYSVNENGGTATITVTRTDGSAGSVTVDYATAMGGTATGGASCTAGVDYVNASGTLTFAGGETSKSFTVQICDDSVFEGDETVNLTLSNVTGGATLGMQNTAVLTIVENDVAMHGTLQFGAATYMIGEAAGNAVVTITRTDGSDGAVTVDYTLANGTATGGASCGAGIDFVNTGGTISFANGETSKTINVTICDDSDVESSETFTVSLTNATGGATIGTPSSTTVTITDNDTPTGLSGVINVGAGETYTSLTNTGGAFEALNTLGATGNVTFNITSDLTGETGTVALNEVEGGFTVTIKPGGAARSISGAATASTALIKINGADNVTIDGSLSGGTDRSLTINNTGAGAILWIATNATSGSNNDTVKNTILVGGGGSTVGTQGIIAGSGASLGSAAAFPQSNNTIQNNTVKGVQNAVFISGNTTTLDQNWLITENFFGSTVVAEKLSFRGILIGNAQNFVVSRNTISGINSSTSTSSTMSGIQIASAINGGLITRNEIKDIRQNNTAGWGSNGIYLTTTSTAANLTISNNFVSDIRSQGFNGVAATDNGYGLVFGSGGGYKVYFNSVNMNTSQTAAGSITAAVNIIGGASGVVTAGAIDLRDNILADTETVGTRFAVINSSTQGAAVFADIDYNDYYAQNVGRQGTTAYPTLSGWQTATGKDANSKAVDPLFVSATDLHLQTTSPVLDMGTPIAGITEDFDGDTRSVTNPDIGADEIAAVAMPGAVQFGSATYTVNEAVSMATITVTRTGGSDGTITVDYATVAGGTATGGANCGGSVDYVNTSGTLTFADGVTSQNFNIPICNDSTFEGDETVNLALSNPSGGAILGTLNSAVLTINDDDQPPPVGTLSISDARVREGNSGTTAATFTVTLSSNTVNRASGTTPIVTVQYSTANGTAIAGSDYVAASGTLTFAAGETTKTINVLVNGDTNKEPNETFYVILSNPINATISDGQGVGIIVDEDRPYVSDFDNDKKADFAVFRPSIGSWYILKTSDSTADVVNFGQNGDVIVPNDYDGDGKIDIAVFRPSTGGWYIQQSTNGYLGVQFGDVNDVPQAADFNGDGKSELVVWRPSTGIWYVYDLTTNTYTGFQFGSSTDKPVVGDYDGDGKADYAVYRPSTGYWYIQGSTAGLYGTQFGDVADKPVPADYDGDGKTDIAVFRPSNGTWYIQGSLVGFYGIQFGAGTDIPVPADYDGDGSSDIAVWRPETGTWYIINSSNHTVSAQQWGQNGDNPVPAAYLP